MANKLLTVQHDGTDHELVAATKRVPPHPYYSSRVSATRSSGISSGGREVRALIKTDIRSFFSAVIQPEMESCNIINAIRVSRRASENEKARTRALINAVETRLNIANFGPTNASLFELEATSNRILLTCDEHTGLDLYGLFAICPNMTSLVLITEAVQQSNAQWQDAVRRTPSARRILHYETGFDADKINWSVLVLRPNIYLFDGQLKGIKVPNPSNPSEFVNRTVYANPQGLFLYFSDNRSRWESFRWSTTREPKDKVSVFAMIINAYSKISRAFERKHAPIGNDFKAYHMLLKGAAQAIMFVPVGSNPSTKLQRAETVATEEDAPMTPATPTQVTFPPAEKSTSESGMQAASSSDPQIMRDAWESGPSQPSSYKLSPSSSSPGHDFSDPETPPEPPEPVLVNDLTSSEIDILEKQMYSQDVGEQLRALDLLIGASHGYRDDEEYDSDEDDRRRWSENDDDDDDD